MIDGVGMPVMVARRVCTGKRGKNKKRRKKWVEYLQVAAVGAFSALLLEHVLLVLFPSLR